MRYRKIQTQTESGREIEPGNDVCNRRINIAGMGNIHLTAFELGDSIRDKLFDTVDRKPRSDSPTTLPAL